MIQQPLTHVAVYSASIANGVSNADLAAINDGYLTRQNNHLILPEDADIFASVGLSANLSRLRLNTPNLRYVGLPSLTPINVGTTVPSNPNLGYFDVDPIRVKKTDEIAIEATHAGGAAQTVWAALWFRFGRRRPTPGPVYRLRGTAAITVASAAWSSGTITLDSTLPQGKYQLVRLDVVGANLLIGRLIIPGAGYRPGVLARESVGLVPHRFFDDESADVLGEFTNTNLPLLECCGVGANTSQEVFMDVIRVGDA